MCAGVFACALPVTIEKQSLRTVGVTKQVNIHIQKGIGVCNFFRKVLQELEARGKSGQSIRLQNAREFVFTHINLICASP